LAEKSLSEFVKQAWPILEPGRRLIWGWHLDAICQHLEAVTARQLANLIISVPPGSSKSTIAAVMWPAWVWLRWPAARFLTASYSMDLSLRDAVKSRTLLDSPWYRGHWGQRFRMASDQNTKGYYLNDQTGFRITTSTTSKATGFRGDYTLVDDALNVAEAESAASREAVLRWYDEAFWNRLNDLDLGGRVVIGQRTHQEDLTGHLLQLPNWVELRIPAEFEPECRCETSLGWADPRTVEGAWMQESRFGPKQKTELLAGRMGSWGYAAQYQQRPVPREGGLFKKEWFQDRRYHYYGEHFVLGGRHVARRACRSFATVDHACSTKAEADWTVVGIWYGDPAGNLILAHVYRRRVEGPDLPKLLREAWDTWRPAYFAVEQVGAQLSTVQLLRRDGLTIRAVDPHGQKKVEHSLELQIKSEAGQVWLPREAPWLADFEDELFHFPFATKDDQVDMASYAAEEMVSLYSQSAATKPVVVPGMGSLRPGPGGW